MILLLGWDGNVVDEISSMCFRFHTEFAFLLTLNPNVPITLYHQCDYYLIHPHISLTLSSNALDNSMNSAMLLVCEMYWLSTMHTNVSLVVMVG